jgi:hypothetical protein
MQAKDIPDGPVLDFIHENGGIGCNWFAADLDGVNPSSVRHAMPDDTPDALVHAKMRRLIRRGLVDGCDCGCRGDFELTEKGEARRMVLLRAAYPRTAP